MQHRHISRRTMMMSRTIKGSISSRILIRIVPIKSSITWLPEPAGSTPQATSTKDVSGCVSASSLLFQFDSDRGLRLFRRQYSVCFRPLSRHWVTLSDQHFRSLRLYLLASSMSFLRKI